MALSCNEALDSLLELFEGTLDPATRQGVEEHLRLCSPCEREAQSYSKATALCCRALRKQPPDGMSERLLAALRERTSQERQK